MHDHAGLTTGDWAQIASAGFTALTALAALASIWRVEHDRWKQSLPDLHLEVLADVPNDQMRVSIANNGGPAREVRILGVIGQFGFAGMTAPSGYWRSGEARTYRISMPLLTDETVYAFVEGRDLRKKQLVVATVGGETYRWPLRKAKKLSAAAEWAKLFPESPGPLDVPYTPMNLELLARET